MNEVDNICEILQRIQIAATKAEEAGYAILRILDQMDSIDQLMLGEQTNEQ